MCQEKERTERERERERERDSQHQSTCKVCDLLMISCICALWRETGDFLLAFM